MDDLSKSTYDLLYWQNVLEKADHLANNTDEILNDSHIKQKKSFFEKLLNLFN